MEDYNKRAIGELVARIGCAAVIVAAIALIISFVL